MKRWRYAANRDQPQKKSLRQNKTSSSDSGGTAAREPSIRTPIVSVEGIRDATVTWGGRKRGGSQARIFGRCSLGSRAIIACRRAPTRAPEASRSPHSSSVQLFSTTLTIT